jgi:hypothetical protein
MDANAGDALMATVNQDPVLLGTDIRSGDENQPTGPAQPISQNEVDDLLYNEEIPTADRLARLRQYRDELTAQETLDFGDDDSADVIGEIDLAIARLEGGGASGAIAPLDIDPADHRETLAPDDDLREAIEEEDEESVEDDLFGVEDGFDGDGIEEDELLPDERGRLH